MPLLDHLETKFTSLSRQGNGEDLPFDPSSSITEQIGASIIGSLENLRPSQGAPLDEVYIDCLILHTAYEKVEDNLEARAVFAERVPRTVRQVGISNVTIHELRAIYDRVEVKPTVVQDAFIPKGDYDRELRNCCAETGITHQAFWTLTTNPELLQSSPVNHVANEAGIEKEVALHELASLSNVDVLNRTKRPDRMKSDFKQTAWLGVWKRDGAKIKIWKTVLGQFIVSIGDKAVLT